MWEGAKGRSKNDDGGCVVPTECSFSFSFFFSPLVSFFLSLISVFFLVLYFLPLSSLVFFSSPLSSPFLICLSSRSGSSKNLTLARQGSLTKRRKVRLCRSPCKLSKCFLKKRVDVRPGGGVLCLVPRERKRSSRETAQAANHRVGPCLYLILGAVFISLSLALSFLIFPRSDARCDAVPPFFISLQWSALCQTGTTMSGPPPASNFWSLPFVTDLLVLDH